MKSIIIHGCRDCIYRDGELFERLPDKRTLVYCKTRFTNVDVDAMSISCEKYKYNKTFVDKDITPNVEM